MSKRTVTMKAPPDVSAVALGGVQYDVIKGYVEVSPAHAEELELPRHGFVRAAVDAEDLEDEAAEELNFDRMSKAELIDFIRERGEQADRKMSKEQLVELASSLETVEPQE